jgi:hypothetical protein
MIAIFICLLLAGLIAVGAVAGAITPEREWESVPIPVRVSQKNPLTSPNLHRYQ